MATRPETSAARRNRPACSSPSTSRATTSPQQHHHKTATQLLRSPAWRDGAWSSASRATSQSREATQTAEVEPRCSTRHSSPSLRRPSLPERWTMARHSGNGLCARLYGPWAYPKRRLPRRRRRQTGTRRHRHRRAAASCHKTA